MDRSTQLDRRDARLVLVTQALFGFSCFGLVTTLPAAWAVGATATLGLVTAAQLTALLLAYVVVLVAAGAGRWRLARSVLFSAWAVYPSATLVLWRPELGVGGLGELFVGVSTAFLAVVLVGFFALDAWTTARGWMALALTAYAVTGVFVAFTFADRPELMLGTVATIVFLLASLVGAGRAMQRDLAESLEVAESRRELAERLRGDMELALQAARGASSAKSRFLANMSHELRTPLTAIIGYVELLEEGGLDDAEAARDLGRVRSSAVHLLGVLNAILDLSKVEAGKLEIELGEVNVIELLDEITQTLRPLAEARRNQFVLRTMELPRALRTDGQKLRQVLLNLLSNAVKFTEGGTIELRADADEERIRIDVIDSGPGIPRDQLDRVFDAFERADHEVTRRVGGTGLGLAISRRFCERLGGTLTVKSKLGEGSTFTVKLPLRPPTPTAG